MWTGVFYSDVPLLVISAKHPPVSFLTMKSWMRSFVGLRRKAWLSSMTVKLHYNTAIYVGYEVVLREHISKNQLGTS